MRFRKYTSDTTKKSLNSRGLQSSYENSQLDMTEVTFVFFSLGISIYTWRESSLFSDYIIILMNAANKQEWTYKTKMQFYQD